MKNFRFIFILLLVITCYSYAETRKFSVCVYHFNIEYVAGGGVEFEDAIVKESFEPLLDMLLKHPNWGATFEFQGYFVDVLGERFPEVLDKMRTLANRDQVEFISFHYSDQLWSAYPRHDASWSSKLAQESLKKYGIPLSAAVFTQEGQFGEGFGSFLKEHNYSIGILPKNLFHHFHSNEPFIPYYKLGNIDVVIGGKGGTYTEGEITIICDWSFMNDGELLATGGMTPYILPTFKYNPQALAEYENSQARKENEGYEITTITKYVSELKKLGITQPELPPILDGVWQPDDTTNVYRWMGGTGAFGWIEKDNYVLRNNYRSRNALLAAEKLILFAGKKGLDVNLEFSQLKKAWYDQCHAEISDSTGWNPLTMEVEYSLNYSDKSLKSAENIIDNLMNRLGLSYASIDTHSGRIGRSKPQKYIPIQIPPIPIYIEAPKRTWEEKWYRYSTDPDCYLLEVYFTPIDFQGRRISVAFPRYIDRIIYSPALEEDRLVNYPLSAFDFAYTAIPLSNGFIGLGEELFLIKHNCEVHIAAFIPKNEPRIVFEDRTAPADGKTQIWKFTLVKGSAEKALSLANRINTYPIYYTGDPETASLKIFLGGYFNTRISGFAGGRLQFVAFTMDKGIEKCEVLYQGVPTGILLNDSGINGDLKAGDGFFSAFFALPPGLPASSFLLEIALSDTTNLTSDFWPYLTVK